MRVSVAAARPELATAAMKVVLPHPADAVMPAGDAMLNVGSTRAMLSDTANGVFSWNLYDTGVSDHVCGVDSFRRLTPSTGATVAVDFVTLMAAIFATPTAFKTTAAVRPLQFSG